MNQKRERYYQWASILLLIASWELLCYADELGYGFLHPLVWFCYIGIVYSAIMFILFGSGNNNKNKDGEKLE